MDESHRPSRERIVEWKLSYRLEGLPRWLGIHHSPLCDRPAGTAPAAGMAAFDHDGRQHPKAIAEGVQIARPMDPGVFETWYFSDEEPLFRYPHMNQRLDLKAVAPQSPVAPSWRGGGDVEAQNRNVLLPEHVESVAEVGVVRAMTEVDHEAEQTVAESAQPRDVTAATA